MVDIRPEDFLTRVRCPSFDYLNFLRSPELLADHSSGDQAVLPAFFEKLNQGFLWRD